MLYNKQLQIIEENTRLESKNVKNFMTTFFEHCLKWKYQPERWETTWTTSIINNSIYVRDKVYKEYPSKKDSNIFNASAKLLIDAYELGKSRATSVTCKNIINNDKLIFNSFSTLESLCNLKYVKEWLITNANRDDMIISVENNTRN